MQMCLCGTGRCLPQPDAGAQTCSASAAGHRQIAFMPSWQWCAGPAIYCAHCCRQDTSAVHAQVVQAYTAMMAKPAVVSTTPVLPAIALPPLAVTTVTPTVITTPVAPAPAPIVNAAEGPAVIPNAINGQAPVQFAHLGPVACRSQYLLPLQSASALVFALSSVLLLFTTIRAWPRDHPFEPTCFVQRFGPMQ